MKTIVPCVQMDTCLFHCTLFIYMEMKWCALKPCLLVLSSRDNEKKIRIACVLGTFVEAALMAICSGQEERRVDERDVQCHTQPKLSFWWIVQFFESMIAVFVLICACYLKDKIIMWIYDPLQLLKYGFSWINYLHCLAQLKGRRKKTEQIMCFMRAMWQQVITCNSS